MKKEIGKNLIIWRPFCYLSNQKIEDGLSEGIDISYADLINTQSAPISLLQYNSYS